MTRLYPIALAACVLSCAGCALWPFGNKTAVHTQASVKRSGKVSTDVELMFRQRWTDKRASDLEAEGMTPEAAKAQAMAEFREKYSYTNAASMP